MAADAHMLRPLDPKEIGRELAMTAVIAVGLTLPMIGLRTVDNMSVGLVIEQRWLEMLLAVAIVVFGRLGLILTREGRPIWTLLGGAAAAAIGWFAPTPTATLKVAIVAGGAILAIQAANALRHRATGSTLADRDASKERWGLLLQRMIPLLAALAIAFAVALPFLPPIDIPLLGRLDPQSRYVIDVATLIVTYVMLGWGLNIIVGYAGLLDLGYVAFYAVGAYSYALLARYFDISFWLALPLAGLLAASAGVVLGFPVLRLRGDYFAIVTLGFGEIIRIIVINWWWFTGGPDGISGVPRPDFFGLAEFTRRPAEGEIAFHEMFGLEYDSTQRLIFLYYLILGLAMLVALFTIRIRNLPIGRAWEALREDDIACASLGIDRTKIKLAAFGISAMWGGFAGSFFATRQGFISPESFTFIESAIILAIVVMGGMGSLFGVALAAVVLIGVPEIFRELSEYRMLAFGAGLVLIMLWRPRGLLSHRDPSVRLFKRGQEPPAGATSDGAAPMAGEAR